MVIVTIPSYVCPKCKSAFIMRDDDEVRIRYYCQNSETEERKYCNWEEWEYLDGASVTKNEKPPFLSSFLFKNFGEFEFSYNHYYYMGELLSIKEITRLAKTGELESKLCEEISSQHPEWKDHPLQEMFNAIQKELRNLRLPDPNELRQPVPQQKLVQAVFVNLISASSIFPELLDDAKRQKTIEEGLLNAQNLCESSGNVFIFTQNLFSRRKLISLVDEIIATHAQLKEKLPHVTYHLQLKRYYILPLHAKGLLLDNALDPQSIIVVHLVCSPKYYSDKKAIVQESFWKRWEYGSRNAPYNPFGKDPGSFWVETILATTFIAELEGKSHAEQSKLVNSVGQEKFEYRPLTLKEAIARCILFGSKVGDSIGILEPFQGVNLEDTRVMQDVTHYLYRICQTY